jgi:tRNA A-37 threonylcarbamoyl transferase component Bud32
VYLLTAGDGSSEQRVLVKRFRDLTSFKWFPLSMWSIGARSFALLGRSRLEKETAINEFLNKGGFRVPKILHVSANERLVFMEYLEGENLGSVVKRIALEKNGEKLDQELSLVSEVGQIYAKVHALNVVLGDTKPENIMISPQREIFLLDFEQASRNGDKSWDVACFLYYSGHYLPLHSEGKAKILARAFVDGYLGGGGSAEVIKCAALARYTRVFSIFTLPGILRVMSNVCKDVKGPKCKKL